MYSNAQKLAAVLNKWAQPAIQELLGNNLSRLPFLSSIEAKIRSTGWVSPMWSMAKEISPILDGVSSSLVEPFLAQYISGIPDESIPHISPSSLRESFIF